MKNVRRITIRDVSARASVSTSTVSKALRNVGYASDISREKVMDTKLLNKG